ncbi:MAG TPA: MBOAT family protein [Polyangiaceae bacterium]|nr:MBOAT family protein [Polyangiaceae bacterium]
MLFNTLAYAKFFAVVFVLAWLLVRKSHALLLPWAAVFCYAVWHPGLSNAGICGLALVLTLPLLRGASPARAATQVPVEDPPAPLRRVLVSVLVNLVALWFMTQGSQGVDPVTLGLTSLGVPHVGGWRWLLIPVAVVSAVVALCAGKVRLIFILLASYVFYAHWDWRFLFLIWGSSTADWLLGNAIANAPSSAARKRWLLGTVVLNLGVLGTFKYFNFFADSLRAALEGLGVPMSPVTLEVMLPIGISFFTFESMSYVIDVYRGDIKPQRSYLEYLSFVAFFPHLVAGPIVRPRDLLPQLAGPPRFSAEEASEGLFLIALGLLKKVAIGDYLALNLVDRVFDAPMRYSAVECYAAVLGYAVQIYCDFSGYTDIAIGSALLLGIRFPLNFNAPYKARDIADFWRRWHISLSTWLRDYLYVPLGGNRKGAGRTYLNLMLTMVLGGLWHGAAWTFVVWGALHGAALAITRFWKSMRPSVRREPAWRGWLGTFFTFHFVCAAWIFFRARSFDEASLIFDRLASLSTYTPNLPWTLVAMLALGLVSHYVPENWYQGARRGFIRLPAPAQAVALFAIAVIVRRTASADAVPFVYFQF